MPDTETGFTSLHYAATRGNASEIAANINSQTLEALTSENHTPLHIAAKFGQAEAIRQLLKAYANKDARDINQQTPLSLCCCYDIEPIIPQLLVDAQANIEAVDNYSWTPIFWTCYRDFDRTYDVLRGKNASLAARDNKLKTPLHWAAERGSVKIIKKMLEADRFIDLEVKDTYGWTPIFWAAYRGQVKAMELLIAHDANKNALDNDSWTPLFWAAYKGQAEAVRYLLGRRVKTDVTDGKGKKAYDVADSPAIKALFN